MVLLVAMGKKPLYEEFLDYFDKLFKNSGNITTHHMVISANFCYGWMPTMLKLREQSSWANAVTLLNKSRTSILSISELTSLSDVINTSPVGVSKLLHMINPQEYAIWDSRVVSFLCSHNNLTKTPNQIQLIAQNVSQYSDYLNTCRTLVKDPNFSALNQLFNSSTTVTKNIPLCDMRVIDLLLYMGGIELSLKAEEKYVATHLQTILSHINSRQKYWGVFVALHNNYKQATNSSNSKKIDYKKALESHPITKRALINLYNK